MSEAKRSGMPPFGEHKFCRERLEDMFAAIGAKAALALINKKACLHIWRRSSPHNWWVAPVTDDYDMIWHSDSEWPRKLPPLKMFKLISESGRVSYPTAYKKMFGPKDDGAPEQSVYMLDVRAIAVWNRMDAAQQRAMKKKYKDV